MPNGAAVGGAAVDLAGKLLGKLLEDAGFNKPTITFNPNDEDHFKLVISGSQPTGDHTLAQSFYSDYWWGDLRLAETGGSATHDSITVTAHMFHHAGRNRPHDGDDLTGETVSTVLTLDAGAASKGKKDGDSFTGSAGPDKKVERHGHIPHADKYVASLRGSILAGKFNYTCDLLSWTYELEGWHLPIEPSQVSLALAPKADNTIGVTVGLGEFVRGVHGLTLALDYDPHFMLDPNEITAIHPSFLANATFELDRPGHVTLGFSSDVGVTGPADLAVVWLKLPPGVVLPETELQCNVVHILGGEGTAEIGGRNARLQISRQDVDAAG